MGARRPPGVDTETPLRYTRDDVMIKVAQAYSVGTADLSQRTPRPSEARQVALYAARRITGKSLGHAAARYGLGAVSRRAHWRACRNKRRGSKC